MGGRRFTTEDEEYLAMITHMAATRIDSLLLFRKLDQHREEMEHIQRELSGAIRMAKIGDVAATLAQELEVPLQAILNVTHIIAQDALGKPVSREDVERVNAQALRTLNVVRTLLELAHSEEQQWEILDISTHVFDAVSASGLLTATAIVPSLQLHPGVHDIKCNRDQMKQVFFNLITNAWDAMPDGGHLAISTRVIGGSVEIGFADTGVGIPPEDKDRIFGDYILYTVS